MNSFITLKYITQPKTTHLSPIRSLYQSIFCNIWCTQSLILWLFWGGRGGSIFQNAKIGVFFHWFVLEIKILHSSSGSKWHQYPASWFFINTDCCKRSRHKLHVATWSKDISCQTFQIKEEKHANHSCHTCNEMLLDIIMDEYISINVLASYILSKVQDFILIFFFVLFFFVLNGLSIYYLLRF